MHRGNDRDLHNGGGGIAETVGPGHNQPRMRGRPVQWQTPHQDIPPEETQSHQQEADLDLVEAIFVEGFATTSDPTSFLRLAHIPFEAASPDGTKFSLLRIEVEAATDVGSITPHLGGTSFRYDPLPASMISRRKRLRFVYFDGNGPRSLDLTEVRTLGSL